MASFRCLGCAKITESDSLDPSCDFCGSPVLMEGVEGPAPTRRELDDLPAGVWRYRSFLPPVDEGDIVTLGEGATPLLRADRLGKELGLKDLLLKDESRNPTGSFMDRGSTVLVSLASRMRLRELSCTTTGNLGASLAAYCARSTIAAHLTLRPHTDQGKLYQMIAYGADIENAPTRARDRRPNGDSLHVAAGNPYLLEGEKTTGLELVQDLGWELPDVVVVPVGTGGHISMIWRAIVELRRAGLAGGSPCRLYGVRLGAGAEAARASPAGRGRKSGGSLAELQQSDPAFFSLASRAMSESGGAPLTTTPAKTLGATGLLARTEGIFAEPSSASVVAALDDAVARGEIGRDERVVCVITGAGLKDPRAVTRLARETRKAQPEKTGMIFSPRVGGTKVEILRILRVRGGYGYDIWRTLRAKRVISTASVYQHLAELEAYGLIRRGGAVVAKGRERLPYQLTKNGADLLSVADGMAARSDPGER